jgi:heme oxygenase (biliverdin-producing, ferredoxin)
MSIMNVVRSAIAASHFQIEQTDFSKGMLDGSMNPSDYSRGLVQLWEIHQALEASVANCPEVAAYFSPEMIRTATIDRDLTTFGYARSSFTILPQTKSIVGQIHDWTANAPMALLGCIYVLEGSRMGSLVIAKPLAKSLGLPIGSVAGIEYHTEGAVSTPLRLRSFKEKVDRAGFDSQAESNLTQGAVKFMEMLNDLYAVLPVQTDRSTDTVPMPTLSSDLVSLPAAE